MQSSRPAIRTYCTNDEHKYCQCGINGVIVILTNKAACKKEKNIAI